MATHGYGRTFPAGGTDGQVPVADETAPSGIAWGDTANIAYTPDDENNWDTPPTTIAEALDELASRVAALETP